MATISAMYHYGDVLRMAIASAANDHRLGANEAPPAILSVFLGDQLEDIMNQIEGEGAKSSKQGGVFNTGVDVLPKIPKEAGDRNRTSPFAFTGNKFELRAVGGSHNIAGPNTVLNAMVAERLDYVATQLEEATKGGKDLHAAVGELLAKMIKEAKPVIFNGDNYSDEWHQEAEKRGLPNLKDTPDALQVLKDDKCVKLLSKYGIYTEPELKSRYNILSEGYISTVNIEAGTAGHIAKTMILPAAMAFGKQLADGVAAMKAAGVEKPAGMALLNKVNDLTTTLQEQIDTLDEGLGHDHPEDMEKATKFMRDTVLKSMLDLRETADALEDVVSDELWPLPTYREMLFVK